MSEYVTREKFEETVDKLEGIIRANELLIQYLLVQEYKNKPQVISDLKKTLEGLPEKKSLFNDTGVFDNSYTALYQMIKDHVSVLEDTKMTDKIRLNQVR